jgi:CO dehydrogenase maturation factor
LKIAVTGKGGVGKTTLAAALSRYYKSLGKTVFAIDADPDANFASALGIPDDVAAKITPIAKMKQLAAEKTGSIEGGTPFFILNPDVSDIPEKFSTNIGGIKFMIMGTIEKGGAGCVCPESALLRSLLRHLIIERRDVVILDMEAGIEHLGRSVADSMDGLIVVVEPGKRSIQTAQKILKLASDIGLKKVYAVINKIEEESEIAAVENMLNDIVVIGKINESQAIRRSDLNGTNPLADDPHFAFQVKKIAENLEKKFDL